MRKLRSFADLAKRLDNQPGWTGLSGLCKRFQELLDRPTEGIPDVIGLVYSAALELGSFLELDNRLHFASDTVADPLEPELQRPLEDLVRTVAPWVRRFPSAQEADDASGQFLARAPMIAAAESAIEQAGISRVLREGDAAALAGLLDAGRRGDQIGNKAASRGVLSARNMVFTLAAALATFYTGAISSDFAIRSTLVQRAGSFLAAAEGEVLALVEDLPSDIRLALESLIKLAPKDPAMLPSSPKVEPARRKRRTV
jgi:hypothetical protein